MATTFDTKVPEITFSLRRTPFDENYTPAQSTRATTNFANLARGESAKENLRRALRMMDNRLNALAPWDNAAADRYALKLQIISVDMHLGGQGTIEGLPLIEMLDAEVIDRKKNRRIAGMSGNSFSSYLRDYDFSVLLRKHEALAPDAAPPAGFGKLHGNLYQHFLRSEAYAAAFKKPPVFCLSASTSRSYHKSGHIHPILGAEYLQDSPSRTDRYFALMGCAVRFFMPPGAMAPLAFYFTADLLDAYEPMELISLIATMESFQRIYRPEIYNANATAAALYRPSLKQSDYSLTQITYDRLERSQLALQQGIFAQNHLVAPHGAQLEAWSQAFEAAEQAKENA